VVIATDDAVVLALDIEDTLTPSEDELAETETTGDEVLVVVWTWALEVVRVCWVVLVVAGVDEVVSTLALEVVLDVVLDEVVWTAWVVLVVRAGTEVVAWVEDV
jgi:hypothetical protein